MSPAVDNALRLLLAAGFMAGLVWILLYLFRRKAEQAAAIEQGLRLLGFEPAPEIATAMPDLGVPIGGTVFEPWKMRRGGREYVFYSHLSRSRDARGRTTTATMPVLAARLEKDELPEFGVVIRMLLVDLAGRCWEAPEIEVSTDPEFGKTFRAMGTDAAAVQKVFTPEIATFYIQAARKGTSTVEELSLGRMLSKLVPTTDVWLAHSQRGWLQLYRMSLSPDLTDVREYVEQGTAVAEMFRSGHLNATVERMADPLVQPVPGAIEPEKKKFGCMSCLMWIVIAVASIAGILYWASTIRRP